MSRLDTSTLLQSRFLVIIYTRINIMARISLGAATVTLFVLFVSVILFNRWRSATGNESVEDPDAVLRNLPDPPELAKTLKAALPQNVLFPTDTPLFKEVMNSYWAKHNREVIPACFVRPESTKHLQRAVGFIQQEHSRRLQQKNYDGGLFAIKAGGAAPAIGSSTLKGGVVIDLGLFREITVSKDKSRVVIGAGLKWMDVYNALQPQGLTVAGGRTLPVGVGGLSLQGMLDTYYENCELLTDLVLIHDRRYLLLLTIPWASLLYCHLLRGSLGRWIGCDRLRNLSLGSLACLEGRVQ